MLRGVFLSRKCSKAIRMGIVRVLLPEWSRLKDFVELYASGGLAELRCLNWMGWFGLPEEYCQNSIARPVLL